MNIFTRIRRSMRPSTGPRPVRTKDLDLLVTAIAASQAELNGIADRVAAGHAEPGDEVRLRLQREITESYRKRLDRITLPTGTGDEAEAWLRSINTPA